jgi:hypothetical protein
VKRSVYSQVIDSAVVNIRGRMLLNKQIFMLSRLIQYQTSNFTRIRLFGMV